MSILEKYKKYVLDTALADFEQSAYRRIVENDKLNEFVGLLLNVVSTSTAVLSVVGSVTDLYGATQNFAAFSVHSLNLTAALHSFKTEFFRMPHETRFSFLRDQLFEFSGKDIKDPYIQKFETLSLEEIQIILHREKELGEEQKRIVRDLMKITNPDILLIKLTEAFVDNSLVTNSIVVSILLNIHKKDPQKFDNSVNDYKALKDYLYRLKYSSSENAKNSESSGDDSSIRFQDERLEKSNDKFQYGLDRHITAINQLLFVFQTLNEAESTLSTQDLFETALEELFKTFDLHLVASYYAMLSQFVSRSSSQILPNQEDFIKYLNSELQNTLDAYEFLLDNNFLHTYKKNSENFKRSKARLELFVETFKKFESLKQEIDLSVQEKREFESKLEIAKTLLSNFSHFSVDQQTELAQIIAKNDSSFKTVQRFVDDNLHTIVDDYEWFKNTIEENSKVSETKIV